MAEKEKKLNKKITRFCEEYIQDYCGAKAAVRAGYAEKNARITASKLLTKSNVKEYIEALEAERKVSAEISEVELIKDLKAMKDNEKVRPADRIKAMELLGRYKGMDKITTDNTVKIVVGVLDEDETEQE